MTKKLKILWLCICLSISFTGCSNFLKSPNNAISSPKSTDELKIDKSTRRVIDSFLPNGAKLINAKYPKESSSIKKIDLNNDNLDELVVTYSDSELHVLILENKNNQWRIFTNITGYGYALDSLYFDDMDKDGHKEILIGWKIDDTAKGLDVFTIDSNKLKKLISSPYSTISISNLENTDNSTELIIMDNNAGTSIYNLDNEKLIIAKHLYNKYFSKVLSHNKAILKESPNSIQAMYNKIEAEIKLGLWVDSIKSIEQSMLLYTDEKIKQKLSEERIKSYLGEINKLSPLNPNFIVQFDHKDTIKNKDFYIIHVFEHKSDHTATLGWYGVSKDGKEIYNFITLEKLV